MDIGFTLNEYTLRPLDGTVPQEPLPVSSEEDIFDYLGMEFKQPYERSIWICENSRVPIINENKFSFLFIHWVFLCIVLNNQRTFQQLPASNPRLIEWQIKCIHYKGCTWIFTLHQSNTFCKIYLTCQNMKIVSSISNSIIANILEYTKKLI